MWGSGSKCSTFCLTSRSFKSKHRSDLRRGPAIVLNAVSWVWTLSDMMWQHPQTNRHHIWDALHYCRTKLIQLLRQRLHHKFLRNKDGNRPGMYDVSLSFAPWETFSIWSAQLQFILQHEHRKLPCEDGQLSPKDQKQNLKVIIKVRLRIRALQHMNTSDMDYWYRKRRVARSSVPKSDPTQMSDKSSHTVQAMIDLFDRKLSKLNGSLWPEKKIWECEIEHFAFRER